MLVPTAISVSEFDKEVEGVGRFKYLSVTLSSNFTWTENIEYVSTKINQRFGISRKIKSLLPRSARILFLNCLILPLFDYADIIWGYNNNAVLAKNLQLLLNKAAKTILTTALFIHLHATDGLEALGWLTLEKRRLFLLCLYLYKSVNETSTHSMDLLANKDLHGYDTQHKDNLRLPRVGRNWGKQRTHYQAAKDWNSLDLCL